MKERIFISSVQKELADERRAICDFVRGDALLGRFFDVFLFEDLPASDRRADEVYLKEVDRCDVYLGLLGNEYGYEDAQGLSPTEREYDQATAQGKVRLIYVKSVRDAGRHPKMLALIRKAGGQLIRRRFTGIADLTDELYASLVEHLARTGQLRTKPFDAAVCPEASLDDLSADKVELFLGRARSLRKYAVDPGTPMKHALEHLNLLDGNLPSHAAVLLFGKEPQRFLLPSEVKCAHFHGVEVAKPIPSYQIYKGTLFELVDQAVDFVMSKINRWVGTRAEGARVPVVYELPLEAVTEAIVNAVTHRDYTSNASVQVSLFADRLEVWNPGHLPPPLTPEALRSPHASIPQNPLIAELMFLNGYAEKAGSGILDMIARCCRAGLPEPQFRQSGGMFIQAMQRPETAVAVQIGTKSGPSRDQVELLRNCLTDKSLVELMAIVGRVNRTKFREQVLNPLLAEGLLEMTIPDRPTSRLQRYRLTDKGRAWLADVTKGGFFGCVQEGR